MNLEKTIVEEQETYPDGCKNNTDSAENSLGLWDIRALLGEIHDDGGPVQRYESMIPVVGALDLPSELEVVVRKSVAWWP